MRRCQRGPGGGGGAGGAPSPPRRRPPRRSTALTTQPRSRRRWIPTRTPRRLPRLPSCAGARGAAVSGVEPATARGVDDRRQDGAAAATGRARRLAVESCRDPTARRAARRRAAAGSGSLGLRASAPLKMKVAVAHHPGASPGRRARDAAIGADVGSPAAREDTVSYVQTLSWTCATRDALRMRGRSPRGRCERQR